jgi:hypothetical protein
MNAESIRSTRSGVVVTVNTRKFASPRSWTCRCILAMQEEPGMFDFYRNFPSFLNVHRFANQEQLIAELGEKVIRPAEKVWDPRDGATKRGGPD